MKKLPNDWEQLEVDWVDESTGYRCLARRHSTMGHWCGYVMVNRQHHLYGVDYRQHGFPKLRVHGGVTWTAKHSPTEWAIGFDCAHYNDIVPEMSDCGFTDSTLRVDGESLAIYKNINFVKAQCTILAAQLAAGSATRDD